MSKTPKRGRPAPGGRRSRSPQAAWLRRRRARRARRARWTTAGAAAAVLAAAIAVTVITADGRGGGTAGGTTGSGSASLPAPGRLAPPGSFTTAAGSTRTISSLRGRPALVWLVATWCPGCQVGTQAMAAKIAEFSRMHVRVVELEDYQDLGQPGPDIASFGRQFAGAAYHSPGWVFGTASQAMTRAWNPRGYLDIYFLLDSSGRIAYVNSALGSTMSQLLARAARLP